MKKRQFGKGWQYKNLTLAVVGVFVALMLSSVESFHSFLLHLGGFGYIGAFIAGMLFVSTFTVATSVLVLSVLAETLSPIEIGLIAGAGAVAGDLIILKLIKNNLAEEIEQIYNRVDRKNHLKRIFFSKYLNWMLPVIGAIIIASPFPDEMGISLLGISKLSSTKFILLSYLLNSVGIFLIVSASVLV